MHLLKEGLQSIILALWDQKIKLTFYGGIKTWWVIKWELK